MKHIKHIIAATAGLTVESPTAMRCQQPGWDEVIKPDGRRGLWVRLTPPRPDDLRASYEPRVAELCAGREGEDAYIAIDAGEPLTAAKLLALVGVLDTLRYAADHAEGDWHKDDLARAAQRLLDGPDKWSDEADLREDLRDSLTAFRYSRLTTQHRPPEPMALSQARREALLEFAKAAEVGTVQLEYAHCACGYHYLTGWGGYSSCPKCEEQELSLDELLGQRCWPGHGFIWHEGRGPCGRWVPADNYVPMPLSELQAIGSTIGEHPGTRNLTCAAAVAKVIGDLRQVIAEADLPNIERAEREAKRASQLADECGQLKAALERKRVECDELRDALEQLRLTDGGRRGVAEMRRRHG